MASCLFLISSYSDEILIVWKPIQKGNCFFPDDMEYNIFKAVEYSRYGNIVSQGFPSVDEFVDMANQVLNRRKSRAGTKYYRDTE